jgi:suppressor of G2 allele of SKP1
MDQAARGAAALQAKDYKEAIRLYTLAIEQSPSSPDYYIQRSTAHHRAEDYEAALRDSEIAVVAAINRAKREAITKAQLRRALALFALKRYGDAKFVLAMVKELDAKDKTIPVWEARTETKLKDLTEDDPARKVTVEKNPSVKVPDPKVEATAKTVEKMSVGENQKPGSSAGPAASIAASVVQTPPSKIKHDWFQSQDKVTVTLLAKGVPKDRLRVDIQERSVRVSQLCSRSIANIFPA